MPLLAPGFNRLHGQRVVHALESDRHPAARHLSHSRQDAEAVGEPQHPLPDLGQLGRDTGAGSLLNRRKKQPEGHDAVDVEPRPFGEPVDDGADEEPGRDEHDDGGRDVEREKGLAQAV